MIKWPGQTPSMKCEQTVDKTNNEFETKQKKKGKRTRKRGKRR